MATKKEKEEFKKKVSKLKVGEKFPEHKNLPTLEEMLTKINKKK